ncbi:hypothetical protein HPB48_022086 [Haemaphysalis longicornis]|uniref:Uncharacterized protein n=1 Tax=Haemaphysalis longicornis TaxID=44386 RepID=A0A9J6GCK4_HAELO|nr:hypothetical protein HPB48_022086 [Haemaphysalis longicornis]
MVSGDVQSNPGPNGDTPSCPHDSQSSQANIDGVFEILKRLESGQVQFFHELKEVKDLQAAMHTSIEGLLASVTVVESDVNSLKQTTPSASSETILLVP